MALTHRWTPHELFKADFLIILYLAAKVPVRIVEKKGAKYMIEWEKGEKTWEGRQNLGILCISLRSFFAESIARFIVFLKNMSLIKMHNTW